MKKVEKLVKILEKDFDIFLDKNSFYRIRPGHWQRSQGAWSWTMRYFEGNPSDFGSQESVNEILKNKDKIVIYGNEIIIEHNKKNDN